MKIAVIVPHRPFFGNISTQFPLFKAIRDKFPNAQIDVWSKTERNQLITSSSLTDQVIIYKKLTVLAFIKKI